MSTYDARAAGARCDACPLRDHDAVVPPAPASRKRPLLIILGEGPGKMEVLRKTPFVGPSGSLLNEVLDEASVERREVHITNVTLCPYEGDEKHLAQAITCCAPRLAAELAALPAEAPIVPLGKTALKVATGAASILNARGFVYTAPSIDGKRLAAAAKTIAKARASLAEKAAEKLKLPREASKRRRAALGFSIARLRERVTKAGLVAACLSVRAAIAGRVVIPSVHPAFILRGADGWRPILAVDVARAAKAAAAAAVGERLQLLDEMPYKVASNAKQLRRMLAKLQSTVAVDIETDSVDPLTCDIKCVGISDASPHTPPSEWHTVVAYPWRKTMARVLHKALAKRTTGTHNGHAFDLLALERQKVMPPHVEDTLLAHHAFASHLPQRLGHVATVYSDTGPWKTKHKGTASLEEKGASPWEKGGDELVRYNAADATTQSYVWHAMQADLANETAVYEADKKMAEVCQQMQRNGIRVDDGKRKELATHLRRRAAALLGEMRRTVGSSYFDPQRPEHVRAALFNRFRAAPTSYTATGLRSTAAGVLEALRGNDTRAGRLADDILRWRSASKSRATFLAKLRVGDDGRVHPSWRAFGTGQGRIACRSPNLMNLPRYAVQECVECRATAPADVERCTARVAGSESRCGGALRPGWDSQVRAIYVASSPRHKLVYFDLKQSEMRAAAYISGDERFIQTCESGDVHAGNASILFPEAAKLFRDDPKNAACKELRDITKNAGFGILYLADVLTIYNFLIAHGFDVELEQVEAMFDHIRWAYRGYYRYVADNIERVKKDGYLRTVLAGRIRWLGWYAKPTEIANLPVQSFIADLMNMRLTEMMLTPKRLPKDVKLVAQIHDAAIFDVPDRHVDDVCSIIKETWAVPVDIPTSGRSMVMPIDLKVGERWSDF